MLLSDFDTKIHSAKKKLNFTKYFFIGFVIFVWLGLIFDEHKNGDYISNFIGLSILSIIFFIWLNNHTKKMLNLYSNTESIFCLFKIIETRAGFNSSRNRAIDSYLQNTIIKYDKDYHTEKHNSKFGFQFIFAESDLADILKDIIDDDIKLAKEKSIYFNKSYIESLITKIKSNEEYQDRAYRVMEIENKKWDKMYETFAKGQGITKDELYRDLEKKEDALKAQKKLNQEYNEKISEENQQNAAFILTTGTCPFCRSKLPKSASKCPTCTADLYQKRKS